METPRIRHFTHLRQSTTFDYTSNANGDDTDEAAVKRMPRLHCQRQGRLTDCTSRVQETLRWGFGTVTVWIVACLLLSAMTECVPSLPRRRSVDLSRASPMNPNSVETMAWQGAASLWIGNRDGVARLDEITGRVELFNGIECTNLLVTRNQESVWCSRVGTVHRYDGESWDRFELEAYRIVEDNDGVLWAGTRQGISRFDAEKQRWLPVLNAPEIAPHFVTS